MPSTSEMRVSASNDSTPASPLLYLWKVDEGGQPRSPRSSVTETGHAVKTLKNARSAGADNLRRTAGSCRCGSGRGCHAGPAAIAAFLCIWRYYSIYGLEGSTEHKETGALSPGA